MYLSFFRFSSLFLLFFVLSANVSAQNRIDPATVTIARDTFGVPHVIAKTDAGAAYGLAYAQAEDAFATMQEPLLALRGQLSSVKGKEGALLDAVGFMVDAQSVANEKYDTDLSDHFKTILTGYVQGINDYAQAHPKQMLRKDLFPVTEKEIIAGYVMMMTFISGVQYDLLRIFSDKVDEALMRDIPSGSNGWAVSPQRSDDGGTYLIVNSHQPLRGPMAWYEVHVQSEEGWNFMGATFAGGITPFVGTNPDLGWAHTVNLDDFCDIYELEMHPKKKLQYKFDDEWRSLEKRVLKLKVKLGPIKVPVKRTFYRSVHGPVLKNKSGYYALRFPSNRVIHAAEQWYMMNKARNLDAFKDALRLQGIASTNVIYGDREGNIMYFSNSLTPHRDPAYNWQGVLPGNTSKTVWEDDFLPIDSLIMIVNPKCGYVYNMNNTAYDCTCPEENPNPADYPSDVGYQPKNTARAVRFRELMEAHGDQKISYEKLKEIKYDGHMTFPLYTRNIENLDILRHMDAAAHPDLADVIAALKKWNGSVDANNREAAIFSLAVQHLAKYIREEGIADLNNTLPQEEFVKALQFAKKHLNKHFGTIDIALGDLQKHVRGDKELPLWGVPEAITQMYTVPYEKGKYQSYLGDSYILFVQYLADGGLAMESIQPYGSSSDPESPHYDDFMEPYINQKLRPVTLDKDEILQHAEEVYHPGER